MKVDEVARSVMWFWYLSAAKKRETVPALYCDLTGQTDVSMTEVWEDAG